MVELDQNFGMSSGEKATHMFLDESDPPRVHRVDLFQTLLIEELGINLRARDGQQVHLEDDSLQNPAT